jgi:hypothetical protein
MVIRASRLLETSEYLVTQVLPIAKKNYTKRQNWPGWLAGMYL